MKITVTEPSGNRRSGASLWFASHDWRSEDRFRSLAIGWDRAATAGKTQQNVLEEELWGIGEEFGGVLEALEMENQVSRKYLPAVVE